MQKTTINAIATRSLSGLATRAASRDLASTLRPFAKRCGVEVQADQRSDQAWAVRFKHPGGTLSLSAKLGV